MAAGERGGGFRDNTRGKSESNSVPQHVHSANGAENTNRSLIVHVFYTTGRNGTFDLGFSRQSSSRHLETRFLVVAAVAEILVSA